MDQIKNITSYAEIDEIINVAIRNIRLYKEIRGIQSRYQKFSGGYVYALEGIRNRIEISIENSNFIV